MAKSRHGRSAVAGCTVGPWHSRRTRTPQTGCTAFSKQAPSRHARRPRRRHWDRAETNTGERIFQVAFWALKVTPGDGFSNCFRGLRSRISRTTPPRSHAHGQFIRSSVRHVEIPSPAIAATNATSVAKRKNESRSPRKNLRAGVHRKRDSYLFSATRKAPPENNRTPTL